MKKPSALFVFLLKAIVGLGLFAIFFFRLDLDQFFQAFSSAHISYVLLALLAYSVGKVVTAVRWALLARPLGFSNPLKDFIAFYYIGMFFNLVGPSTLGGDAGKVFYLSREKSTGEERSRAEAAAAAVVSILADRLVGMVGLVWIAAVALLAFPEHGASLPAIVRYAVYAMALGPFIGWLAFGFGNRLLQKIAHPLGKKLYALGSAYWNRPAVLGQTAAFSVAFHLIQVWCQILIGRALGFDIPWSYACVFFPLVDIITMLPVSISGIGFREGGLLFFLSRLGVGPEKAVANGVLWLAIVVATGLAGGIAFVLRRRK
ncbi:MAG TPA: lysylphosphatidylglycerol synthase transmembrane domain-containing protein [Candidatus Binatia bacterium]|jgi:hypothetical protein